MVAAMLSASVFDPWLHSFRVVYGWFTSGRLGSMTVSELQVKLNVAGRLGYWRRWARIVPSERTREGQDAGEERRQWRSQEGWTSQARISPVLGLYCIASNRPTEYSFPVSMMIDP